MNIYTGGWRASVAFFHNHQQHIRVDGNASLLQPLQHLTPYMQYNLPGD
jgi:hypothetical protein